MMKTKSVSVPRVEEVVLRPSEVKAHFEGLFFHVRVLGWWILERIAFQYPDEKTRASIGFKVWENDLDLEAGRGFLPYLEEYEKKGIDAPVKVAVHGWASVVIRRDENEEGGNG
jgi:hypothetical protein